MIREIFFVARSLEDHEIFETWHPMSLQITPPFLFGNERDYDTFSTIENSESYSEMISSKIIDPFTRSRLFDYSYNLHLTFAFNLYEKKTTKDRRVNFPIISDRILIESEAKPRFLDAPLSLLNSFSSLRASSTRTTWMRGRTCTHFGLVWPSHYTESLFAARLKVAEVSRGREFVRACNWRRVPCRAPIYFLSAALEERKKKKERKERSLNFSDSRIFAGRFLKRVTIPRVIHRAHDFIFRSNPRVASVLFGFKSV